jgi:uncharacterized membrane protein YqgA involved in biofilm formation
VTVVEDALVGVVVGEGMTVEEEVGEAGAVLEDEGEDEEDEGVGEVVLEFYPSEPPKITKNSSL